MKKPDFIAKLATASGMSKGEVTKVMDAFSEVLAVEVKRGGDSINYPGLGAFKQKKTKARIGHNPATGETINVPEKVSVVFKPAKELKDATAPIAAATIS